MEGKNGFKGIIFGRTLIVILAFIIQVAVLLSCFAFLKEYVFFVYGGTILMGAGVIIYLVNRPGNPDVKLVWMIPIIVMPIFGILLYIYISLQPGTKMINHRLSELSKRTETFIKQDATILKKLSASDALAGHMAEYLNKYGGFPVYQNTSVRFFALGEEKYRLLLEELKGASKFIFLEYFIIELGEMWGGILDVLKEKAEQGVEVRVLYDGLCCLTLLPVSYPKKLQAMGIKCKMFSPIRPALSSHYNYRDHRKIAVIDGVTAFTGGVNLADEYINKKERFGHWKDTAVMIRGSAVERFTFMFLEMWDITELEEEDYEKYLTPKYAKVQQAGQAGFVIPYASSPFESERTGKRVYLEIINTATEYIHIMTPYLILDYEMMMSLTYAAKRGVEVCIILPHIPDKKGVFALAHSYYMELIQSGVLIFEYTPGFVHAKIFISDHTKGVIGTVNLDYRSLDLHFECGVFLYGNPEILFMEEDFQQTLDQCQQFIATDWRRYSLFRKIQGRVMRLFAPMM